jgi:hypothetical protein
MLASKVFELNLFAQDRLRCKLSEAGVNAFSQCGRLGPDSVGVGWRLRRWRCSLSFPSDTSISDSLQTAPPLPAWWRPRRLHLSKIQLSIPRTKRTIFARSARRFISPRRHSCRTRPPCRCRSRLARSSISAISISFLSCRNVRPFNRALLRLPDSQSLLI